MNSASMARRMIERGLGPATANAIAAAAGEEAERSMVITDRLEAELGGLERRPQRRGCTLQSFGYTSAPSTMHLLTR